MSVSHVKLPQLVLEDYMSMLQGMVILSWAALVMATMTKFTIGASAEMPWPDVGSFSLIYNAILVEFGLNTFALTTLLFYPDWYERIPRESAQRVRWLLIVVILWFSIHLFAAFHVTGSLDGALLLFLPIMLVASLIAFPGRLGWLLAGFVLFGHLLVLGLENFNFIRSEGLLGQHFRLSGEWTPWTAAAVLSAMILAAMMAWVIRHLVHPMTECIFPAMRVDPDTGLFRREFLVHRVEKELDRMQRQGGSVALLLVAPEDEEGIAAIPELSKALVKQIRIESDTPASYRHGVIAVLLPAAGPDVAKDMALRIVNGLAAPVEHFDAIKSVIAVVTTRTIRAENLLALADKALAKARAGAEPLVVFD